LLTVAPTAESDVAPNPDFALLANDVATLAVADAPSPCNAVDRCLAAVAFAFTTVAVVGVSTATQRTATKPHTSDRYTHYFN
jgi:hypothetical protein